MGTTEAKIRDPLVGDWRDEPQRAARSQWKPHISFLFLSRLPVAHDTADGVNFVLNFRFFS